MFSVYKIDAISLNQIFIGLNDIHVYKEVALLQKETQNKTIKDTLNELTINGVIDGDSLSNQWFPQIKSDIFISYSHNDEELALILAGFLIKELKLSVFLDCCFWNSADELNKIIDEKYSKIENGKYYYNKVLFSTSHVHSMLTMSIMEVMNGSEMVLFLNTPNTIPTAEESINKTKSPWIFEELMFTQFLKPNIPQRLANQYSRLDESTEIIHNKLLNISYTVPVERIEQLSHTDIKNWCKRYKALSELQVHALDVLYSIHDPQSINNID